MEKLESEYRAQPGQPNDVLPPQEEQIPEADRQVIRLLSSFLLLDCRQVLPLHEENQGFNQSLRQRIGHPILLPSARAQVRDLLRGGAAILHEALPNCHRHLSQERRHHHLSHLHPNERGQEEDPPHCQGRPP